MDYNFETAFVDEYGAVTERHRKVARQFDEILDPDTILEMIGVPAGAFSMGAADDEEGARENERPRHLVSVPGFWLGKHPVTQKQWSAVMKDLPKMDDNFRAPELPVVNVWLELALEFCTRLSQRYDREYRLPTEAEWEYACRAGTSTPFNVGQTIASELANFDGEQPYGNGAHSKFRRSTTEPGSIGFANGFGLHDMHGNVWEWCADIWHTDYLMAPKRRLMARSGKQLPIGLSGRRHSSQHGQYRGVTSRRVRNLLTRLPQF
jgi:formylglycine-generating enzyme required for sulfatase activity